MTATKHDSGKPMLSMIPNEPLMDLARVFMFGAKKYGRGNWRNGFHYSRLYDAVMRHMMAWFNGEDLDEESGLPHLSHATWGLIILRYYQMKGEGTDDRDEREYTRPANKWDHIREKMSRMSGKEDPVAVLPEQSEKERLGVPDMLRQAEPAVQKGRTIAEIQRDIAEWADRLFPDRNYHGTFNKLVFEEIPELVNGGVNDPMEYADILILVLDLAYLVGVDAEKAVTEKMVINRKRSWAKDGVSGLYRHVESQYTGETEEPE